MVSQRASGNDQAPDARERILRATVEVIAESGWRGASTRLIAQRAGVNNALLHYYFGTKRALLQRAALALFQTELSEPMRRLVGAPTLTDGMADVLDWIAQYRLDAPGQRVMAEILLEAVHDPDIGGAMRRMLVEFRGALAARVAAELPSLVDPRGLAVLLAALLDGLLVHRLIDPEVDLGAAAVALRSLLESTQEGRDGGVDLG